MKKKNKNGKIKTLEKKDNGIDIAGIFGSDKTDSEKINSFGVLMEDIQSKFELLVENNEAINKRFESVDRRFDAMDRRFDDVDKKFEFMFSAIKCNKEEIVKTRKDLSVRIDEVESKLTNRIDEVESKLTGEIDEVKKNLISTEKRLSDKIDKIGERVDNIEVKVNKHDEILLHLVPTE